MQDFLQVSGMVVGAYPQGEYDRRIVLLTKECGKITAFVKGARRQGSRFTGSTDLFAFGNFELFVGKNSYTVQNAEILNYFEFFRDNLEAAYYGMYFIELQDYYTRENNDEAMVLLLLYRALQGLKSGIRPDFVRRVYEIKLFIIEGELIPPETAGKYSDPLRAFVERLTESSIKDLFTVGLKEEYYGELVAFSDYQRKHLIDRPVKSLQILEMVASNP